jgi:hypothetical protein
LRRWKTIQIVTPDKETEEIVDKVSQNGVSNQDRDSIRFARENPEFNE